MAILSFAHLKNKNRETVVGGAPPSRSDFVQGQSEEKPKAKVLSFAHLRGGSRGGDISSAGSSQPKQKPEIKRQAPQQPIQETKQPTRNVWFKFPAIMPTARLQAVNYCKGCPRFLPAEGWEKALGKNTYGRCRRDDDEGREVWRVIPAAARVKRCWYWM